MDADFEVEFVKFQNLRLPTEPRYLYAMAGYGQLSLSWVPPGYTGNSAISGYTATALTTDTPPQTAGSCSTSATPPETAASFCTISGLANGTPYIVSVQAINGAGVGAIASTDTAATPVASVAVPPTPSLSTWAVLLLNLLASEVAALGLRWRRKPAQA